MVTVEIDDKTAEGKELLMKIRKYPNAARRVYTGKLNGIPEGYMTADEWRTRCKGNISEIFRKYEQGLF